MKLAEQLKTALNDNRLLMLGAQVLFGFQFNAVFQDMFDSLTMLPRTVICAGLMLLVIIIGLLVAPSMQHRLVEPACASSRMLAVATACAGWALLPLATALALDVFIAMDRIGGAVSGAIGGGAFFILALSLWYFLEFWLRARRKIMPKKEAVKPTPLDAQVEQLLTEARVIIPGGQALLGFQLAVTLTRAFAELPTEGRWAHAAALCCVGLSIILLMAPASLHRIAFGGQDHPDFVKIGSALVIAAPLPLAFGIALDAYVAASRALTSEVLAAAFGLIAIIGLLGVWYGYPLWRRFFAPAILS